MKKRQILLPLLVVAVSAVATSAFAQKLDKAFFKRVATTEVASTESIEWRQFGPGTAGYCEEFWCHPTDTKTMLIGPDMHVGYGSWNYGESWQGLKDCDGSGDETMRIIELAFSRQNPDLALYIDRDGNVKRSDDRGRTWEVIYNTGACLSEIAVDPTNDKKWYIGAGDFFNVKDTHRSLAEPQGNMNSRAQYGYILKSTDQGRSWKKITKGLPENVDVGRIMVNPKNPKRIVAVTGHGLYVSTNEGLSWTKGGAGLPNNLPRDISAYYDAKSKKYTLYLVEHTVYTEVGKSTSSKGGVFRSDDGGDSWVDITGNLAIDLTKISSFKTKMFYAKTVGKWFGINQKEAFKKYSVMPKSTLSVFNHIRVHPTNPDIIYIAQSIKHDVGFAPGDIWVTMDGGKSWNPSSRMGKYWIEGKDKEYWTYRGSDMGKNIEFAHLEYELDRDDAFQGNRFMEVDAAGNCYICIDQQMLRSEDNGKSWKQIDDMETAPGSDCWVGRGCSDMPGRYMLLDAGGVKGRHLLCSGEHGLWETAPLGDYPDKTAVAVRQLEGQVNHKGAHSISSVAVHPADPNKIYMLMFRQEHRGELRRSVNGGKSWANISKPIDYHHPNTSGNHIFQYSLMFDKQDPNNLYFCTNRQPITEVGGGTNPKDFKNHGVYRSQDEGYTWEICNNGLPEGCSINRLEMDPENSSIIYAASNRAKKIEGGLYRTTDKCDSWEQVSIPSNITSVNDVHVSRIDGKIYIACGEKSTEAYAGGVWVSANGGKSWTKIFEYPCVWQVEASSIAGSNTLIVSAAGRPKWGNNAAILNAGIYISHDGGASWDKANRGLVQMDKITDVRPDNYDPNVFWCAGWGSGWYKGVWKK